MKQNETEHLHPNDADPKHRERIARVIDRIAALLEEEGAQLTGVIDLGDLRSAFFLPSPQSQCLAPDPETGMLAMKEGYAAETLDNARAEILALETLHLSTLPKEVESLKAMLRELLAAPFSALIHYLNETPEEKLTETLRTVRHNLQNPHKQRPIRRN